MNQTNQVVVQEAVEPHQSSVFERVLAAAVDKNMTPEMIGKLMELNERFEALQAKKAFVMAMSQFKDQPLDIFKAKTVDFTNKSGVRTTYKHAELHHVVDVVVPAMAKFGLSHRWDVKRDGGRIFVTCVVTHRMGHSESIVMDGPLDETGNKNAIQQAGSTITYLERYTLLAILGLSTKGEDDDGGGGEGGGGEEGGPDVALMLKTLREKKTDAEALGYWNAEKGKLVGTPQAYQEFKDACVAHRLVLKKEQS